MLRSYLSWIAFEHLNISVSSLTLMSYWFWYWNWVLSLHWQIGLALALVSYWFGPLGLQLGVGWNQISLQKLTLFSWAECWTNNIYTQWLSLLLMGSNKVTTPASEWTLICFTCQILRYYINSVEKGKPGNLETFDVRLHSSSSDNIAPRAFNTLK